jgi:hypothetical protein
MKNTTAVETEPLPKVIEIKPASVSPRIGLTLAELKELFLQEPPSYLIEGLLPSDDIHVAVGDSGLGKTAWAYQLGLCVATGKPFLGHPVRPSRVLHFDLENGLEEIIRLSDAMCKHLDISREPKDFIIVPNDGNPPSIERAVADRRPGLVTVDTMRALFPEAEESNTRMGQLLQGLRSIARSHHCAILLIHHLRKPGETGGLALENTPLLEWLLQAAGARAVINQTNTRIGLDRPKSLGRDEAALVMKSFVKLKGESADFFLERVCDTEGEPLGYRTLSGAALLGNPEQETAVARLPQKFAFKEAKAIYNRSDDPTRKWLLKCEAAGLVRQVGRGSYERLLEAGGAGRG